MVIEFDVHSSYRYLSVSKNYFSILTPLEIEPFYMNGSTL